jgi:hypothetical protein
MENKHCSSIKTVNKPGLNIMSMSVSVGPKFCSRPSTKLVLLLLMLTTSFCRCHGYPSQEGIYVVSRGLKDVNVSTTMPPNLVTEDRGIMTSAPFIIRFSTWPQNLELSNLHERAMRSLGSIFCHRQIQEGAGDTQCILRNETIKTESLEQVKNETTAPPEIDMEAAGDTLLFMDVKDFEELTYSTSSSTEILSWTEWSIPFLVTTLGSPIIHTVVVNAMVNTTETPLTAQSIYAAGVEFLGDQLSEGLKKNILSGNFDRLMNERSSIGSRVVTSIPGMEAQTFYSLQYPLVAPPSSNIGGEGEESKIGLHIALFFAGLGVGLLILLVMFIVTYRRQENEDQDSDDKIGQTERDESRSNNDDPMSNSGGRQGDMIVVVETSQSLDDRIRRGLRRSKSTDSRSSIGGDSSGHQYPRAGSAGSVVSALSFAGSAVPAGSAVSGLSDSVASKLDYEKRSLPDQEESWA